ncbi:MAG: hypothetical protein LBD74_02355 [Spirochaetaceae bacterium]|nr:hypothetical protein [Spirochaetaceae bacterium]
MGKELFLTTLVLCLLALGSCEVPAPQENAVDAGPERWFWAKDGEDQFYQLEARELVTGTHSIFYVETANQDKAPRDAVVALADEFDTKIFPLITRQFGDFLDMDQNGKVLFLLLDIRDLPGIGYTAGYFYSGDMYDPSIREYSNKADMIYVDINPGNIQEPGVRYNLAHEFQHLVNFSVRQRIGSPQDVWINEGLSSAAEYLYAGEHLKDRIDFFNDPRTSIPYGNNFYYWNDGLVYGDRGLANYATVYLFFQWLRIHTAPGKDIYKEIVQSEYGDYRGITDAAARCFDPPIACDWELLLQTWLAANYLNEASGLYGYKGELVTQVFDLPPERPYFIKQAEDPYPLFPGEAVYSELAGDTLYAAAGNIRYAGLPKSGPVDTDGAYAKGWKLLTFNSNTSLSPIKIESGRLGEHAAHRSITAPHPERPLPALHAWEPAAAFPGRHDWFGPVDAQGK